MTSADNIGADSRASSPKRKPLSKKLRFDVFKRDGFICQYCGAHPPAVILHVDHINPVARGGINRIDNLITSCEPCNLGKGARPLTAVPRSLAEKAVEAAEREEQILGYQKIIEAARERVEGEAWRVAEAFVGETLKEYSSARMRSIRMFIQRIGVHEVLDAAEKAATRWGNDSEVAFRYFCGICWKKVRGEDWG